LFSFKKLLKDSTTIKFIVNIFCVTYNL